MGWIKKFLRIKKNEEFIENTDSIEEIKISELNEWFKKNKNDFIIESKLNDKVVRYSNKLKDKKFMIKTIVDDWNSRITSVAPIHKVKEIKPLFLEAKELVKNLNFKHDDQNNKNENYHEHSNKENHSQNNKDQNQHKIEVDNNHIIDIHKNISEIVDHLLRKLKMSSFATEFSFILSDEQKYSNYKINPLVKEIEELKIAKDTFNKEVFKEGFKKLNNIEKKIAKIKLFHFRLIETKEKLKRKEEAVKNYKEKKEEKEKAILKLNQEFGYPNSINFKLEQEDLIEDLESNKEKVYLYFLKIKPALKQLKTKHPNNRLITKYIEKSTVFFYEDKNWDVITLLDVLKEEIICGKLGYEATEMSELVNHIELGKSGYLKKLQNEQIKIKSKISNINVPEDNKEYNEKLDDLKYRLNHFTQQYNKVKSSYIETKDLVDDLTNFRDNELNYFQDLTKKILNKEVKIIKH